MSKICKARQNSRIDFLLHASGQKTDTKNWGIPGEVLGEN